MAIRLGLLLGFEDSIDTIVRLARAGEEAGMGAMYTVEAGRSALVPAAAVIGATERVRVGSYIVNAYARDPWLTAIAARDLDELSGGRFVLGIGTGNRHLNEWYLGKDSSKPMTKMREYLDIVRAVVAAEAGEAVRYNGQVHRIRWRASWSPTRPHVPVYLSASGPNMIRLAGEKADGVGVGILASVAFMNDVVRKYAAEGAASAERDPAEVRFPMGALVSVHRDPLLARDATRFAICGLFHPVPHPYYESQLRRLGFQTFVAQARALMPLGRVREAMRLVPDEVIDTMTVTGTPEQCAGRIADYEGVADEVIAMRVAQLDEPTGQAAYAGLFEMASLVAARS